MPFAIGSQVPLPYTVRDGNGALVDVATMTINITLPDGTAATPLTIGAGISRQSLGTYQGLYTPVQAGRHTFAGVTTGPTTALLPDAFNVVAAEDAPITSLADARSWLNINDPTSDDKIRRALAKATEVVEWWTGLTLRRSTVTEVHDGGRHGVRLRRGPVASITSVTEAGTALSTTPGVDWTLDQNAALLHRGAYNSDATYWTRGVNTVAVTYVVGLSVIPDRYLGAVEELTRHFFRAVQTTDDADEAFATSAAVRQLCVTLMGPRISTF